VIVDASGMHPPRVVTAFAIAVATLLLVGCSTSVAGRAAADHEVVARIAQERACHSAGEAIIIAVRTMVRRVDSAGYLDGPTAEAMMKEIPVADLGRDLAGSCGRELIHAEYSRLLVALNGEPVSTLFGRVALNAAISGLCNVDGSSIVINQQARVVCAGRSG
jgi:hypothetical protein